MSDSLAHYDTFIFDEMMVHPLFFTHPHLKKIAVVNPPNQGLAQEIVKHNRVTEIWQIGSMIDLSANERDQRLQYFNGTPNAWLSTVMPGSMDAIIMVDNTDIEPFSTSIYQQYTNALNADGIFIRPCDSLFHLEQLKFACEMMRSAGVTDLQILHFPQPGFPAGMRTAIMAVKNGVFKRIREKDIFNKTFTTRYYNYDTHKAALAMPEFMRGELML